MIDFEARQIIEALRSGVSSKATSQYFAFARPRLIADTEAALDATVADKSVGGMVISGKYGEGKTHLLNTVFNLARQRNMVVSHISLSKETPFDKLYLVYQKLLSNTYLPGRMQPGFEQVFENMTQGSPLAGELLEFCKAGLETNKLYFLLKAYLSTEDDEEKYALFSDLEGYFFTNAALKKIYRRIYNEPAAYNVNFSKTKHCMDYFAFMSQLFGKLGYGGWVLLFDETELVGRLGKKARLNAYRNMASFLLPEEDARLRAVYSAFALTASFAEDVIESKHEYENLENAMLLPDANAAVQRVLDLISSVPQLAPLNRDEIVAVLQKVTELHGRAYAWQPGVAVADLFSATDKKGHLLRTRIRAAVEFLDQLYQYGACADVAVGALAGESYEENLPSLEELL